MKTSAPLTKTQYGLYAECVNHQGEPCYNIPYLYFLCLFSYLPIRDLYLIKLLSILFDVLLAWAAMKLVGRATQNPLMRAGCFLAVLFWPTVFLNGALWAQCDSIYVAFALLGIWLALEDKPIAQARHGSHDGRFHPPKGRPEGGCQDPYLSLHAVL